MAQNRTILVPNPRQTGFQIMDVLLTMAIVAILLSIAVPSYQQQVLKARRQATLLHMQVLGLRQEAYHLQHGTYGELGDLEVEPNEHYDFSAENVGNGTYRLIATAVGQQQEDRACQRLSMDQSLNKTPADCW
ncbi:hypothetical protein LJ739_00155 [Aestuariibacter halophilus]|uniref:Type IV pilus assembly protein PilE n=1 Tax=Fluctibacter halophilus TaxID=226011 RepID=A0ABS8G4S0_9ALTE|nr:type IV pilin protein [Aestuariibacter halophilus]MCC2614649.1 hypothetical protein [Aestuariibacter halophilus]